MAIASLILGIISLLTFGIPMTFGSVAILAGLIAIILGILGRRRLLEEGRSAGMAIGGIVIGIIGLLGGVGNAAVCVACLSSAEVTTQDDEAGQRAAEEQLQQLQDMLNAEAQESSGTPAVPATPGVPATPSVPAVPTGGQTLTLGTPTAGVFTPGLPVDPSSSRPYIQYTLNVTTPGSYTIDLVSQNANVYDPYLILMQNGAALQTDDDGGGYPNARITRILTPGSYVVRASSFSSSQATAPSPFVLTVVGG